MVGISLPSGPSNVFYSNYQVSIDDKGRVAVPSAFRRLLPESVEPPLKLVAVGDARFPHIKVYTTETYSTLLDGINSIEDYEERDDLRFELIGNTVAATPDAQGRIQLSASLRAKAGISGSKVVVVGQERTFDIYDEATHRARSAKTSGKTQSLSRALVY